MFDDKHDPQEYANLEKEEGVYWPCSEQWRLHVALMNITSTKKK